MTDPYCEKVKAGDHIVADFAAFLRHLDGCKDCCRRIYSRILIEFKMKEQEKHLG
jgi:hypothetical protein